MAPSQPAPMRFEFDELRATQAAALLLKLAGGRENYTKLLKLLYLADRKSLGVVGRPIAGAKFCNMKAGPLASDVYDCVKGDAHHAGPWDQSIAKAEYELVLQSDPGESELSDFDVETLTALFEQHRARKYRQMIDFVHELPEWVDPTATPDGPKSLPLPAEKILRSSGATDQAIQAISETRDYISRVDALLS